MSRTSHEDINLLDDIHCLLANLENMLRKAGDKDNAEFISEIEMKYRDKLEQAEEEYTRSPEYLENHPYRILPGPPNPILR